LKDNGHHIIIKGIKILCKIKIRERNEVAFSHLQEKHTEDNGKYWVSLLLDLGFETRIQGDHHILFRDGIPEIINLQPLSGNMCKPYQVK